MDLARKESTIRRGFHSTVGVFVEDRIDHLNHGNIMDNKWGRYRSGSWLLRAKRGYEHAGKGRMQCT
jgi:hypothetical protein